MTPRATYRLQFSADFTFADATGLAPYLAALGITHVYASPVFEARPDSTHGYDVTDPNRFNRALGGPADFRAMADAFRAEGLGLLLDIVPNHMGISGDANAFWLDVLRWGRDSAYAAWFDIDWASGYPGLAGKVLLPFLGDQYGAVLTAGGLELRTDPEHGFAVWAHDSHKLPVCPASFGRIFGESPELAGLAPRFEAATPDSWPELKSALDAAPPEAVEQAVAAFRPIEGDPAPTARLDALIATQHWRAAKHSLAADAINYRRFFTISDLAGVRVEVPAVFEATHRLILDLVTEGLADGLRVDHIDGLRDPKGYCLRLRESAAQPIWLLVEKILAPDERLPAAWETDGTTGYEVTNLLALLLTDPAGTATLSDAYAGFTGRTEPPGDVVHAAKLEVTAGPMAAETEAIVRRLHALAAADPATQDLGPTPIRTALVEFIAALDVYRTYADPAGLPEPYRARVDAALAEARRHAPFLEPLAFDLLERVVTLDLPDEVAFRIQQLSGPATAKGLEDKALYRYDRLIALNEVGSEPGRFSLGIDAFHAANAERQAAEPRALLTTSTHDTKRGEDARLRIAALAGRAAEWRAAAEDWRERLPGAGKVDPNELWFLFQLLVGVWPAEWRPETEVTSEMLDGLAGRVEAAMLKSAREADRNTAWVNGDATYERRLSRLVHAALDPDGAFLPAFRSFEAQVAEDGRHLSLVQTALKLTIPGVPDIYQGAERWEQSLVDPDNRRPVDFAARAATLARCAEDGRPPAERPWPDGTVKLALTATLLDLRRRHPDLFASGSYQPLAVEGPEDGDVLAFARRHGQEALVVVAALRPARPPGRDTRLADALTGPWHDVLAGRDHRDPALTDLLSDLPVAVLLARPD